MGLFLMQINHYNFKHIFVAVSTRGKSFQGSIKYRQHRFENKPGGSAAVAKVLPIRPKVALSPVPRIKKEKTFLL